MNRLPMLRVESKGIWLRWLLLTTVFFVSLLIIGLMLREEPSPEMALAAMFMSAATAAGAVFGRGFRENEKQ